MIKSYSDNNKEKEKITCPVEEANCCVEGMLSGNLLDFPIAKKIIE